MTRPMSLFDEEPRYCIDTNVIISFLRGTEDEYYGSDVFAPQWQFMERLMSNGTIVAPRQIEKELIKWCEKIDGLSAWLKQHKDMFRDVESAQLASAKKIVNTYTVYGSTNNYLGDLTVISLAASLRIAALSLEGAKDNNSKRRPKIPNVCQEFGIDFVSVTGFLRRERFGQTDNR